MLEREHHARDLVLGADGVGRLGDDEEARGVVAAILNAAGTIVGSPAASSRSGWRSAAAWAW